MRKVIARVYDYALDGVIATEGTEFFQFCRDLPDDPAEDLSGSEFYAGADLHIMGRVTYHGGISLWRSLARLDLIDEYRVTLVAYVPGEGPRLFEEAGKSRQLDLLSSTAFSSGLQLHYRRHRSIAG